MALKAAPLNASSAPTHTSSQEHRAPWHPQDIDGLGGASPDDNDAGSHTTGKKHKKASCLRVSFACVLTLVLASE